MIPFKKITPHALRAIAKNLKNRPLFTQMLGKLSVLGAQAGQDFWIYGEAFNEMCHGYFIDIGAHDGVNLSNTYVLEKRYKWSGMCVEANPKTYEKLTRNRQVTCVHICVDEDKGFVDFVMRDGRSGIVDDELDNTIANLDESTSVIQLETMALSTLLTENNAPTTIDYLSIDIEGAEDRVLLNFDFTRYKFKTITIERPSAKVRSTLSHNGYLLIKEIPNLDCFYIHKSFEKDYKRNLFNFYADKKIRLSWK